MTRYRIWRWSDPSSINRYGYCIERKILFLWWKQVSPNFTSTREAEDWLRNAGYNKMQIRDCERMEAGNYE